MEKYKDFIIKLNLDYEYVKKEIELRMENKCIGLEEALLETIKKIGYEKGYKLGYKEGYKVARYDLYKKQWDGKNVIKRTEYI